VVLAIAVGVRFGLGGVAEIVSIVFGDIALLALGAIVSLALVPVVFGACVRRLHDWGKPGWWTLALVLPCVNLAVLFLLLIPQSSVHPHPKDPSGALVAMAGVLAVLVVVVGAAPFLVPSLLQKRIDANTSAAIEGLQRRVAGQMAYARINGSFFDSRWECLGAPAHCIPSYSGAPFLDEKDTMTGMSGYDWHLFPARAFRTGEVPEGLSPTSTDGFVIVATPSSLGQTADLALCGDSFGSLCYDPSGQAEGLLEQLDESPWIRCSATCTPLQ
jgi:uncharacterized membrane protein YhaH (DUF805 family)